MQIAEFVEMVCREIEQIGSQKKAAKEWGISTQYLNDIIRYRREPGRKLLDEFGLYKHVSYEPKDTSKVGITKELDLVNNPRKANGPKFMTLEKETE